MAWFSFIDVYKQVVTVTHSHMLAVLAHADLMTCSACVRRDHTSDLTLYRRVGGIVNHVELDSVKLESHTDDYNAFWCAGGSRIADLERQRRKERV